MFEAVMQEYLDLGHTKAVPREDMSKSPEVVFYLPMHVVYKTSSTTTKVRAVFDASAKSSSGTSLNDIFLLYNCPSIIDQCPVAIQVTSHCPHC